MVSIINSLNNFEKLINSYGDPRTTKWVLVSNPVYTVAICLTYIYIVKILGPRMMESRKPFDLKRILMIYNLYQIIFSSWMFYEFAVAGWLTRGWSYKCQPMDYTDNPKALRMAAACWWFYISKFIDFFDTIFFILRKKNNQVTKLHVIHHSIVPISAWFGTMIAPGGHGTFCCFLNSFVHVIMYTYYFLASLGPEVQKYLWWKKYITTIQMIQFMVTIAHSLQLLFFKCNYPQHAIIVVLFNSVIFLFLFSDFYKDTYKKSKISNSESLVKNVKHGLNIKDFVQSQRILRIKKMKTG